MTGPAVFPPPNGPLIHTSTTTTVPEQRSRPTLPDPALAAAGQRKKNQTLETVKDHKPTIGQRSTGRRNALPFPQRLRGHRGCAMRGCPCRGCAARTVPLDARHSGSAAFTLRIPAAQAASQSRPQPASTTGGKNQATGWAGGGHGRTGCHGHGKACREHGRHEQKRTHGCLPKGWGRGPDAARGWRWIHAGRVVRLAGSEDSLSGSRAG